MRPWYTVSRSSGFRRDRPPNGFGAEYPESIIDIFHVRRGVSLVVAGNDTVTKNDVAPIPSILVVEQRHQSRLSACREIRFDFCVVTVQIGIAVENKKRLSRARGAPDGERPRFRAASDRQRHTGP